MSRFAPNCASGWGKEREQGQGRVRKGGVIPGGIRLFAVLLPMVFLLSIRGESAWGASLIGGSYTLNWDDKVDKKGAVTTETRTYKQTLDIKYTGFLNPVILNELTLKVEQEKTSDGENKIRVNPILTLGYKGAYWNAGAKRSVEESNEAGKNSKTTDSYFMELFVKPARPTLPDLKAKYNLDQDFEQDTTDTSKHAFTASSVYRPMEWIQIQGDYTLNRTYDDLKPDSDTRDDKRSVGAGIRHMFSQKIKFNTEYKVEEARGATYLDAGGSTNQKRDISTTWKNTLAFRPFKDTSVDASYDFDLKQNMINDEHTLTQNIKAAVGQRVGILDLAGDFLRTITEPRHTADDNRKTDDTWTAAAKLKFSKQLDFLLKYQDKTTDEVHFADATKDTTSASKIYSGSWNGDLTPFWKATASFDRTDTFTKEIKTTVDKKYSLKSVFALKAINLTLDPTYDITIKEDLLATPQVTADTRDFKCLLGWRVLSTNNIDAKIAHTYGRKTDSAASNIQRTDDTAGNVTWKEPLPGWNFGFDVTRTATDTSGDDLAPDISSSYGFKGDYKRNQLALSTSYKFDKKTQSDNSEIFDAKFGWVAPHWDVTLTYNFTKTFSDTLNEGYTISLAFKYTL
jgi:hypothetical protein